MKAFAFLYNQMVEESTYATVSIHLHKSNAIKAMKAHKKERRDNCKTIFWLHDDPLPFGYGESWVVREIEILD